MAALTARPLPTEQMRRVSRLLAKGVRCFSSLIIPIEDRIREPLNLEVERALSQSFADLKGRFGEKARFLPLQRDTEVLEQLAEEESCAGLHADEAEISKIEEGWAGSERDSALAAR